MRHGAANAISVTPRSPLRVVIPGGSGQVGNILARHFHSKGDEVLVLARKSLRVPWRVALWDGVNLGSWANQFENADVVINVAGRSVNCRYNAKNRREIMDSRTESTRIVGEAIRRAARPPRIWMNASTATIYRHAFDRPMDEFTGELGGHEPDAPNSWRFSIEVAKRWEETFFSISTPNTRRIALRSALTLSPDSGGIFDLLLRLVRFGFGGTASSGRQFVSWIHHLDFVHAVEHLIASDHMDGAVNLAAPEPLPNREFMRALRQAWGTPIGLPSTKWMLQLGAVLLRTETELMLKSRRVVSTRLQKDGFQFQFPDWPSAARDLVHDWRARKNLLDNAAIPINAPAHPSIVLKDR